MEDLSEAGSVVEREELMVSPSGDGEPTKRSAHFLQPTVTSIDEQVFELPSGCFSSIPPTFEPKNWPLKVNFYGWRLPQKDWRKWVEKMASLHEPTWKKAGIQEAILNSTYEIRRNTDLVLGLAEKWCSETKSFIFSWGEATMTLEDLMIHGYSVLGFPVFIASGTKESKKREETLNQARLELNRISTRNAEHCLWMKEFMNSGSDIEHEAFLALWLSRFVFPISYSIVTQSVFPIAIHLARGTKIALAPAILAGIYRDLRLLKEKIVALTKFDKSEVGDSGLAVTIWSPFQLVQIWAWERFIELRPKPNLIKIGETRFARWHKMMMIVDNVRRVLDSAKENFDWRPYAKALRNCKLPEFYVEKEMWVSVDSDISEEFESLARCLRISELVGRDCVEHYLPHRVAMQFGIDQDLPACVARANETFSIAWSKYINSIGCANLYVPSRLFEADITTRYSEWWKQSVSRLQGAARIFRSSKITQKNRSKRVKRVNHITEGFSFSRPKMKTKESEETSTEKEDVSDASDSSELPSKMLPLSLIIKKEINMSPFPPGFPPKTNLVEARDSTTVDNLTTTRLLMSSMRHSDVGNGQLGDGEHSSGHCQKFSSSKVVKDAEKIVVPSTEPIEKMKQNELVKSRLETSREDATGSKTGSPSHDMEGSHGVDGGVNENELQLEDRVSRLERFFAELKAARYGRKKQIISSE